MSCMSSKADGSLQVSAPASKQLAKFLCSLPCLKDLKIAEYHLHDDFFTELRSSPASSQIQTMEMCCNARKSLQVSAPASKQLAKFLCSLPCLEDLTIRKYHLHDDFFTELSSSPTSSQIQTMYMWSNGHRESLQVSATASKQLAKFLCSLPCLDDLTIDGYILHDDFFTELRSSPVSSQIRTVCMSSEAGKSLQVSAPASKQLAKFLCSLPCLKDLKIEEYHLHDDFFTELSSSPASSQIQTMEMCSNAHESLQVSAPASKQLAKFLCSLPCLNELTIRGYHLHDDFFTELSSSPASSQIQRMYMWSNAHRESLQVSATASKQLAKFLCSLPCLKNLIIGRYNLHDDFFTELRSSPVSSQIQTVYVWSYAHRESLQVSATASKQLAKFLCSLPCLHHLTIDGYPLHDDFFTELSSSPSFSQIQTMLISDVRATLLVSASASKQLAKFLCSLPCLKDLNVEGYHLHDDFYIELSSSPASSQNRCLREMLEKWRRRQQVQLPPTHEHEHRPLSTERVGSNLPSPRQPAQPSVTYQNVHQRDSQAESDQVHYVTTSAYQQQLGSFQQVGSNILHPRQAAQPSSQCPNDHKRRIPSKRPQSHQVMMSTHSHERGSFETHWPNMLQQRQPAQPSTEQHSNRTDIHSVPSRVYPFVNPTQQHPMWTFQQQGQHTLQLQQPAQPSIEQQSYRTDVQSVPQRVYPFVNPTQQQSHRSFDEGPSLLQLRQPAQPSIGQHSNRIDIQQGQHTFQLQQPAQLSTGQQNNHRRDIESDPQQDSRFVNPTQQHCHWSVEQQGPSIFQLQQPAQPSTGQQVYLSMNPTQQHTQWPFEQQGPNILQLQQPTQPSVMSIGHQNNDRRGIQSDPQQVSPFVNPTQQRHHWSVEQQGPNILELQQTAQAFTMSIGHQNRRDIQSDLQQVNPTQQHPTGYSAGMNPMYEYDDNPDRPSTSGLSSAYSRAASAYDDSTPVGRKRIYSDSDSDDDHDDDDDAATDGRPNSAGAAAAAAAAAAAGTVSIAESREHRPRKRLAKTDRNPPSP